jgi:hypothetical protein
VPQQVFEQEEFLAVSATAVPDDDTTWRSVSTWIAPYEMSRASGWRWVRRSSARTRATSSFGLNGLAM